MTSALPPDEAATLRTGPVKHERAPRSKRTHRKIGPGVTFGTKYVLLHEIGQGALGVVYAAENTWTGRRVAIKVLRVKYACVPEAFARFQNEARITASLRHPHIVDVLDMDVDAESGAPFIVEELLDGEGYDAALERAPSQRVSPVEALRVLLPVLDALAACHARGVVHRDVKPSNIFLCRSPDGVVTPKLIDFGVSKSLHGAKWSIAGQLFGTPRYMAPEQARGETDIDARADVWAIGVTLFEAITGRAPFERTDQLTVLAQVRNAPPPRLRDVAPEVPVDLANVIDRALKPERDERMPTMRAFIEALLACEVARELAPRTAIPDAAPRPQPPRITTDAAPAVRVIEAPRAVTAALPEEAPRRLRAAARVGTPMLALGALALTAAVRWWSAPHTAAADAPRATAHVVAPTPTLIRMTPAVPRATSEPPSPTPASAATTPPVTVDAQREARRSSRPRRSRSQTRPEQVAGVAPVAQAAPIARPASRVVARAPAQQPYALFEPHD